MSHDLHLDDALDAYRLPLLPAPPRVLQAVAAGVASGAVGSALDEAVRCLSTERPCADGVVRAPDGRVRVLCCTDLPGVEPAMIDWWFGWHLPSSARYRLWHPAAHVKAVVREDRSARVQGRERYIGNESYVDEYIGRSLKRLTIAFVEPALFGFDAASPDAVTICATTSDRLLGGQGGCLVHHVVRTPGGAQMRSGFWLGEVRHSIPLIDRGLGGLLNSSPVRRLIVPDRMALDLLQHCGEEMNHLARFLPGLYAAARGPAPS